MPETPEAIRGLADTMITRFTPPSFVPGCEVQSIADIDEYTTNNGWIEAIVGGDNQQRVRYYGTPQGVAVNDFVDVEYFPAYKLYRVFGSTLGGTASVGGLRVNKVWASDFSSESLVTDASDNVTINTGTLTLSSNIIHLADPDNLIGFDIDKQIFTIGGLVALQMTNTTQNLVEIGDVAGTSDWDVNINNGQMFLQGSDGFLSIGDGPPVRDIHVKRISASAGIYVQTSLSTSFARFRILSSATHLLEHFQFGSAAAGTDTIGAANAGLALMYTGTGTTNMAIRTSNASASILFGAGTGAEDMRLDPNGNLGISVTPTTRLGIGAGAIEGQEMTAPGAGAANTGRIYFEDNGAGKTRLMVIFSTGAAQQLAIQP